MLRGALAIAAAVLLTLPQVSATQPPPPPSPCACALAAAAHASAPDAPATLALWRAAAANGSAAPAASSACPPCTHASCFLGIALLRAGDMDGGVRALQRALSADASDYAAAAALGVTFELLARRLASARRRADATGAQFESALRSAVQLLTSSLEHQRRRAGSSAARPQDALVQPPTVVFRALGTSLHWLGREAEARAVYARAVAARIGWSSPWARPVAPRRLMREPPRGLLSAADGSAPPPLAALLRAFEAALPAMRGELPAALDALLLGASAPGAPPSPWSREAAGLADEGGSRAASALGWSVLLLRVNGRADAAGCALAPAACALLAATPLADARGGQAKLSLLAAGTRVRPHAGPSADRLRVHCTLRELRAGPAAATLLVGERAAKNWRAGECFILDDSLEHAVVTAGGASDGGDGSVAVDAAGGVAAVDVRVVLLVDIANPLLAEEADFVSHAVGEGTWAAHAEELREVRRLCRVHVEAEAPALAAAAAAGERRWGGE